MLKKVLFLSFAIISATTFSFAQVSGGGGSSPKKKPIAPTSITAVAPNIDTQSEGSTSNVVVSWTDNATNETGYYAQAFWQNTGLPVYDESINFVICNGGVSATTCTVTNAPATVDQMYFMVTAFNSYGSASATSTAIPTVKTVIAPTSITAVAPNIDTQSEGSTSNVVVSWTDNATNETGYYAQAFWQNTGLPVYDESINFVICNGGVSATTCTVTNAPATVDQMYFMVTAFNSYGSASATSTAIPTVKAPTVPQNLWLSTEDSVTFSATWDEVSNANSYHAQVYKLVRSAQVPGFVEVLSRDIYLDKNTRTFSESGVSGNPDEIGFYVKVRAVGNGLYSDFAESFPVDY